ncbi:hypothetical protein HU200_019859 [Digitaria exilis]|uniref:DUF7595 domain-containing protein n=1 Tax=Digitaria exilis TaxID=1010633 RepID=A0A835KCD6_9POAL|nr:hypothetical protein HU200_019859 [Digitaria exilis]
MHGGRRRRRPKGTEAADAVQQPPAQHNHNDAAAPDRPGARDRAAHRPGDPRALRRATCKDVRRHVGDPSVLRGIRPRPVPASGSGRPAYRVQYVLLVGDGGDSTVGRPFKVVKVSSMLARHYTDRVLIQTFSSERGTWGPIASMLPPSETSYNTVPLREIGAQVRLDRLRLEWFAEMSGIVLVTTSRCGYFWLDLRSRKIIRHFPGLYVVVMFDHPVDLLPTPSTPRESTMADDVDGVQNKGLPMDVMLEIAGGTDPETIVRLAATCKDLRRYIADPSSFRGHRRLRLRRGERLVPSLLGGQLVGKWGNDLYIEDTASNLIATGCFCHDIEPCVPVPVTARDGLVLVRVHHPWQPGVNATVDLRVCCPSTGRVHSLPPCPSKFKGQFVLLVGDGDGGAVIGRPFKVLNVSSVGAGLGHRIRRHRFEYQTFSSERGTWGPHTKRWPPHRHGYDYDHCSFPPLPGRHLVVGGSNVYWVYRDRWRNLDDRGRVVGSYYVFKLDVGDGEAEAGMSLTSTTLPPSFRIECDHPRIGPQQILLAATAAGRPVVVLVANHGRISAWTMSEDGKGWADQPQVVIENEAMTRFGNVHESSSDLGMVQLEWFAERSGVVQVTTKSCGFFWLHLQSRKIIRHFFPGSLYTRSCPYEIDLSSWVPNLTFNKTNS